MQLPILSILIFFPVAGIGLLLVLNKADPRGLKIATMAISLVEFCFSLPLWFSFNGQTAAMQFVERRDWLPTYGISYYVGVDGFSLLLILLTTFLTPICVLATWEDIQHRVKEFMICLLALMSGMIGVFVSLDLFLFYVFWEVMLIPMYLLIGVWGNPARRVYAAVKFFLFTMFPFRTWVPDAHPEAPTVGSVILAAVLLKMGTYGFLRFNMPMFPEAAHYFVPLFSILAIIGTS